MDYSRFTDQYESNYPGTDDGALLAAGGAENNLAPADQPNRFVQRAVSHYRFALVTGFDFT
jgi:hypothetical protein